MKLLDDVYLVGSGRQGVCLTHDLDSHVYLIDGGSELALVDAGVGRDTGAILARVRAEGFDPGRIRHLLLTHAHLDHCGGAASLRRDLRLKVAIGAAAALFLRDGDERGASLDQARAAGLYPSDYHLDACPVDLALNDGDTIQVGEASIVAIATPGHCTGHCAFLLRREDRADIFTGDALFAGGRIALQNIWDCSLAGSIASVEKLGGLSFEGFFPGHQLFSLRGGARHVAQAMRSIRGLLPPPQAIV